MQYIVIENTPGYLPEDDDPFIGSWVDALGFAAVRVEELKEQGYEVVSHVSSDGTDFEPYAVWHLTDPEKSYDLGRVVEVTEYHNETETY